MNSHRHDRYTTRALEKAAQNISHAKEGSRNNTLNVEALGIGQLVGAGMLSRVQAEDALMTAARACGLSEQEAKRTIKSGLDDGEKNPRVLRDHNQHQPPQRTNEPQAWVPTKTPDPTPSHLQEHNRDGLFFGTEWAKKTQPSGKPFSMSFQEMLSTIQDPPQAVGEEDAPQWTLATFKDHYRSNEKFEKAHGLVLDFDQANLDAIKSTFALWTHLGHTTKRSTPEAPRCRVLIPLTRPVNEQEYKALVQWTALKLPGVDTKCGPAQAHFKPAQRPGYEWFGNQKKLFDPDSAIGELPRLEAQEKMKAFKLGSFLGDCWQTIMDRLEGRETPIPMPPAWGKTLPALMGGGWWPGMTVLVGNTGTGKSQFAIEAGLHAAEQEIPVVYIALELDELGISCRSIGLATGEKWSQLYNGQKGDIQYMTMLMEKISKHWASLNRIPFLFDQGSLPDWNPEEMENWARIIRTANPEGPAMMVLDFIQLAGIGGGSTESLRERIGKAAYLARIIAKKYRMTVLVVSGTARGNYKDLSNDESKSNGIQLGEGNPARLIGTAKEAGEVEYAADFVLVLGQESLTSNGGELDQDKIVHVAVAKVRAGVPGWAKLRFDGNRFEYAETPAGRGGSSGGPIGPGRADR